MFGKGLLMNQLLHFEKLIATPCLCLCRESLQPVDTFFTSS
jgi:hypothetical protein